MTSPAPPASRSLGTGCLLLFLLPFATTGVFTGAQAVGHALSGDWGPAAFMGIFGLTFGLVGVGGILAVLRARRHAAETDAIRGRNPEAPWLWRPDWAAGRIEDSNRGTMVGAWIFAGFWNLVSLPGAYFGIRQLMNEGEKGALFVLIFPAVGLGLLVWAIRATLRYRRFGVSRLDLATVPAPLGGELRGAVIAPVTLDALEGVQVTLTSVRRVTTGSGKNRSTSETVLWQEEQRARPALSRTAEGMVTSVPVTFRLPPDAESTDGTDPRNQVVWRLVVTAEVPGVDYHSTFEVPVFRTAEPAVPVEASAAGAAGQPFVQLATSRIKVTRNRRGTEILFPAARNPAVAAGLTLVLALWLAAVWATVHLDAPLLLQIVFAAFGLLLAWATVSVWFGVSRITVGDGSVAVATGVIAPMRERRMPSQDVAEVVTRIGMQAGGRPFYDLVLMCRDGRQVYAGRGVRDKREAEWLADTLREALRS